MSRPSTPRNIGCLSVIPNDVLTYLVQSMGDVKTLIRLCEVSRWLRNFVLNPDRACWKSCQIVVGFAFFRDDDLNIYGNNQLMHENILYGLRLATHPKRRTVIHIWLDMTFHEPLQPFPQRNIVPHTSYTVDLDPISPFCVALCRCVSRYSFFALSEFALDFDEFERFDFETRPFLFLAVSKNHQFLEGIVSEIWCVSRIFEAISLSCRSLLVTDLPSAYDRDWPADFHERDGEPTYEKIEDAFDGQSLTFPRLRKMFIVGCESCERILRIFDRVGGSAEVEFGERLDRIHFELSLRGDWHRLPEEVGYAEARLRVLRSRSFRIRFCPFIYRLDLCLSNQILEHLTSWDNFSLSFMTSLRYLQLRIPRIAILGWDPLVVPASVKHLGLFFERSPAFSRPRHGVPQEMVFRLPITRFVDFTACRDTLVSLEFRIDFLQDFRRNTWPVEVETALHFVASILNEVQHLIVLELLSGKLFWEFGLLEWLCNLLVTCNDDILQPWPAASLDGRQFEINIQWEAPNPCGEFYFAGLLKQFNCFKNIAFHY